MTYKRFPDSDLPGWELEQVGSKGIAAGAGESYGVDPNAVDLGAELEIENKLEPDTIARNGRNGTKAVTLGAGVIPGTGFQFYSPDGTRTILRPGDFFWETDRVSREAAYRAAALAFVALRYRSQKVSEPPLQVSRLDPKDGTLEWLPRHPLAKLLEDPSPDFHMGQLLRRTQLYVDITGSAVWVKANDGLGQLARLTPYSQDEFSVETAGDRVYGKFTVNTLGGSRVYGPEQVVHFQEVNPDDWHVGLSLVDVMLTLLNLGQQTTASIRAMLRNALIPSVIVTADKDWSPNTTDFERWKSALDAYALPANKGKPLALLGGGRAQIGTLSVENLMPEALFSRIEATVAAVSGIPAVILSFLAGLENSPWSQMSEARRMAYEDTIEPLWQDYQRVITRQLLRPVDPNRDRVIVFDTTKVRALQPDRSVDSQIVERLNTAKVATGNELRALVGLEPIDDPEWDEPPDRNPPVPIPGMPGAVPPGGEPEGGRPGDEPDDADKRLPTLEELRATLGTIEVVDEAKLDEEAARSLRWKLYDSSVSGQEIGWLLLASGQLDDDRTKILRLARETLEQSKAADDPADAAAARELAERVEKMDLARAWRRKVTPAVKATADASVAAAATDLGLSFSVLQPGVPPYVADHAAELVTNVTRTTKDAVKEAIATSLESRETTQQMISRIGDAGAFGRSRAQLIARTEVTEITNGAGRDALTKFAADTGTTVEKSWLSARDPRVRPDHRKLDSGEWLPVDERFANGLTHPGEPNCRCTLLYRIREEA